MYPEVICSTSLPEFRGLTPISAASVPVDPDWGMRREMVRQSYAPSPISFGRWPANKRQLLARSVHSRLTALDP